MTDPDGRRELRVLLAEDEPGMRSVMRFNLQEEGFVVTEAERGDDAVRMLSTDSGPASPFHLVIADLKMPGADGMAVLKAARARDPQVPVIIVTAFGTMEQVAIAIKEGASDYITKPFQRVDFKSRVAAVMKRSREAEESPPSRAFRGAIAVTASSRMREVLHLIERVAATDATVLVTGESGTGKELVARMLHDLSDRASGPFLPINCAALPRDLLENEIFGHERGAFTGADRAHAGKIERAHRGTFFLDEIAELPLDLQSKLLRVLEEGMIDRLGGTRRIDVDVRVVAATNRDLRADVAGTRFRADLYHRLSVIPVDLPPLRERPEDIPLLVAQFLDDLGLKDRVSLAPALLSELARQRWPGNVRELKNAVSRMALLRRGDVLDLADFAPLAAESPGATPGVPAGAAPPKPSLAILRPGALLLPDEPFSLPELEREIVEKALAKHEGNRSAAARYLGIPRHVLLYRLEKFKEPEKS